MGRVLGVLTILLVPAGCGSDFGGKWPESGTAAGTESGTDTAGSTGGETPAESVLIEGGTYRIGCLPDLEQPELVDMTVECSATDRWGHEVTLDSFWIDRTEVSRAAYMECVAQGDCLAPRLPTHDCPIECGDAQSCDCEAWFWADNRSDRPVMGVSWDDARRYCEFRGKRLPTEAEWEVAARGHDAHFFPWGEQEFNDGDCVFALPPSGCQGKDLPSSVPVDSYPLGATPGGVLHMVGNVAEWTLDRYSFHAYWPAAQAGGATNPEGGQNAAEHVYRGDVIVFGGPWVSEPVSGHISPTSRFYAPNEPRWTVGFRCVRPDDGELPDCGNGKDEIGEACDGGPDCTEECELKGSELRSSRLLPVKLNPVSDELFPVKPLELARGTTAGFSYAMLGDRGGSWFLARFRPDELPWEAGTNDLDLFAVPAALQTIAPTGLALVGQSEDLVVVGSTEADGTFVVQRYSGQDATEPAWTLTQDGLPGPSFGSGAHAVLADPSGHVFVAGHQVVEDGGRHRFMVWRIDDAGVPVWSAEVPTDPASHAQARALTLNGDELIVAGHGVGGSGSRQVIVQRIDAITRELLGAPYELPPAQGSDPTLTEQALEVAVDGAGQRVFVLARQKAANYGDYLSFFTLVSLDASLGDVKAGAFDGGGQALQLSVTQGRAVVLTSGTVVGTPSVQAYDRDLELVYRREFEPWVTPTAIIRGPAGTPMYVGWESVPDWGVTPQLVQPTEYGKIAELIE